MINPSERVLHVNGKVEDYIGGAKEHKKMSQREAVKIRGNDMILIPLRGRLSFKF